MAGHDAIMLGARSAVGGAGRAGAGLSIIAAVGLAACAQSMLPDQASQATSSAVAKDNVHQQAAPSKPVAADAGTAGVDTTTVAARQPTGRKLATAASANAIATGSLHATRRFRDCENCPEMIEITAGSFMMGSDEFDEDLGLTAVTIEKPFAIGKFEVTFAEWQACARDGGCAGNQAPADGGWGRERRPVVNVSWHDARQYTDWLSHKTGQRYRLPSEAEWERAARAGSKTRWSFGSDERRLREFAWYEANASRKTQPVGGKAANAFGLHDMHGNVWEWVENCRDEFRTRAASEGEPPTTERHTDCRFRGGSWNGRAVHTRSAQYDEAEPTNRSNDIGFRIARDLAPGTR